VQEVIKHGFINDPRQRVGRRPSSLVLLRVRTHFRIDRSPQILSVPEALKEDAIAGPGSRKEEGHTFYGFFDSFGILPREA
jgi:hypothetical protein